MRKTLAPQHTDTHTTDNSSLLNVLLVYNSPLLRFISGRMLPEEIQGKVVALLSISNPYPCEACRENQISWPYI